MAGRVDIFITTKVIIVTHAALPDRGKYVLSSNHFGAGRTAHSPKFRNNAISPCPVARVSKEWTFGARVSYHS